MCIDAAVNVLTLIYRRCIYFDLQEQQMAATVRDADELKIFAWDNEDV